MLRPPTWHAGSIVKCYPVCGAGSRLRNRFGSLAVATQLLQGRFFSSCGLSKTRGVLYTKEFRMQENMVISFSSGRLLQDLNHLSYFQPKFIHDNLNYLFLCHHYSLNNSFPFMLVVHDIRNPAPALQS